MALTCPACGAYGRPVRRGGVSTCAACGATAGGPDRPVLIVTGAAAAGKSAVCADLAGRPGLLALDGDVLAGGAAAVADGRRDYPAFWHHLLELALEVHDNGLVPVFCGVCRPEQVLSSPLVPAVAAVRFLALVSGPVTVRRRIEARPGPVSIRSRLRAHVDLDADLRAATVPAPHQFTTLDTTDRTVPATLAAARTWAAAAAR